MQGVDALKMSRRHVFGVKADVKDNVHYIDDQTVAYPVGRTFVIYNQATNTQKFIMGHDKAEAITAMALTPNKKYIAVATSGDNPSVEIFDTTNRKRRKILTLQDPSQLDSREYVCLAFSHDGRHLVTQGGAPGWNLVFWTWDRSKALAITCVANDREAARNDKYHINCCSINPLDPQHVCVSGNGVFKFLKYTDGQLKVAPGGMGKRDPQEFLCHRWLRGNDNHIIVSTSTGDLLLVENCEFKCPLPLSPADGHSINCLQALPRGFICGGDMGLVSVYERSDEKELYRKVKTIKIDQRRDTDGGGPGDQGDCVVSSFSLSQAEDYLAISTRTQERAGSSQQQVYGQLWVVGLQSDSQKADVTQPEALVAPFHGGAITGIDTCVRKPLVATCSKDKTIRIWNYVDHSLEILKTFGVEALSVALHPSGLHLLVGFTDKLRFMNLYGDDIKEFRSFHRRSCPECRFSNGGQYFAFVHGQVIELYSTYTCEQLHCLRGPTGKIRCLYWLPPDDTRLLSAGHDGAVYDWNVREGRKENDNVMKSIHYSSVVANGSHPTGLVWVVGNDKKLREMEISTLASTSEWPNEDTCLTSLAYASNHKLLFAGSEDGSIKVAAHPLQNYWHQAEVTSAHSGPVTRIALTTDESVLFSVSEDGSLWIFDVREREGRGAAKPREVTFAEEILISKADLEEKNTTIQELKQKVEELRVEMDYQARKRDIKHDEKIKEMQDQFKEDSEKQWAKFDALLNLKYEQESAFTDIRRDTAERHRQEVAKLEADYQAKIQAAEDEKNRLQVQLEQERNKFQEQLLNKEQMFEKTKKEMDENFQELLSQEREMCESLRAQERDLEKEHAEIRKQLEKDTDDEIEEIKDKYEKRLQMERDTFLQLKGDNGIMRKKFTSLQKEIAYKEDEIRSLEEQGRVLETKTDKLNHDIDQLKAEIKERDETIGDKEKRIYDLKKKNQELEKFKFVLDFKIRELKSQIEPRQDEIAQAKQKIKEMDGDLEKFHQQNLNLRENIDELKKKIDKQQQYIHHLSNKLKDSNTYRDRVRTDLSELVQKIQEPRELAVAVGNLYRKYVKLLVSRGPQIDEGLQTEYTRQREFLEKTADSLKRKLIKDAETHNSESNRVMNENVQLIREINELRKEIKVIRTQAPAEKGAATARPAGAEGTQDQTAQRELEMQRSEMSRLRQKIAEAEQQLQAAQRPGSGQRLEPIQ
eukprot:TRINITY_DN15868_c0_g1_i1.p1 TRINITY_DN15868_c0_g1~~TRINITY_DN15868_c0_g1_i1.p1  ORF type:complete len:1211 (+),score=554.97 TRINITY_DN15868_c0_g1_i1:104-3736(+)